MATAPTRRRATASSSDPSAGEFQTTIGRWTLTGARLPDQVRTPYQVVGVFGGAVFGSPEKPYPNAVLTGVSAIEIRDECRSSIGVMRAEARLKMKALSFRSRPSSSSAGRNRTNSYFIFSALSCWASIALEQHSSCQSSPTSPLQAWI